MAETDRASFALEACGVTKLYEGIPALQDVDLAVKNGSIHGLLGQNGAGKSTLVRMLAGAEIPNAGSIRVNGREVEIKNPVDSNRAGIYTIYQELSLVPTLTVAENIFLSSLPRRRGLVDWEFMRSEAIGALARVGFQHIPVDRVIGSLSVAEQQAVELAKALYHDARVLLLDEPTSALPAKEVESLFDLMTRLRDEGQAMVFISHRLDEVTRMCDEVTVLRDGRLAARLHQEEISEPAIVRAMIGRSLENSISAAALEGTGRARLGSGRRGDLLLKGRNLADGTRVKGVDLEIHEGEVLGLAGLVGSGQSELAQILFGARPGVAGSIEWRGKPFKLRTPHEAIRAGIGMLPQDRKAKGFIPELDVASNMTLATLDMFSRFSFLRIGKEREAAREMVHRLGMKVFGTGQIMKTLSGGTQQKAILARWLLRQVDLLICDEPTRGIDVGAKEDIYELLRAFCASGGSVVIASSEVSEALMCDRVLVLRDGEVVVELSHEEIDPRGQVLLDAVSGAAPARQIN